MSLHSEVPPEEPNYSPDLTDAPSRPATLEVPLSLTSLSLVRAFVRSAIDEAIVNLHTERDIERADDLRTAVLVAVSELVETSVRLADVGPAGVVATVVRIDAVRSATGVDVVIVDPVSGDLVAGFENPEQHLGLSIVRSMFSDARAVDDRIVIPFRVTSGPDHG